MALRLKLLWLLGLALAVVAIDNGLALRPPMTWSSWGSYGCEVAEDSLKRTADLLVHLGLVAAGYNILQIDDCWSNQTHRSEDTAPVSPGQPMRGKLMANRTKFPSGGLAEIAQYAASRGLQLGIYTDLGLNTCARFPGSYGHYCEDASTFAAWGVTYIKQDFCGPRPGNCGSRNDTGQACYSEMSRCVQQQVRAGHKVLFSMCSWGADAPWTYAAAIANSWRISADQQPCWESVMRSVDNAVVALPAAGPGGWNDLDELFMVKGRMSFEERRTMFNFWTMFAAPLSIGDDLDSLANDSRALGLYTNREVIAIDQDALGKPAVKVSDSNPGGLQWSEVWARPLANGDAAVLLFNRGSWGGCISCDKSPSGCACVGVDLAVVGAALGRPEWGTARVSARFVWNHTDGPGFVGNITPAILGPHESLLIRLRINAEEEL